MTTRKTAAFRQGFNSYRGQRFPLDGVPYAATDPRAVEWMDGVKAAKRAADSAAADAAEAEHYAMLDRMGIRC